MNQFIPVVLMLLFINPVIGQINGLDLLGDRKKIEIPFDYSSGYLLVDVKFQDYLDLTFIFDTGAEHIVLFDKPIADILGLEYHKKIEIYGADLNTQVSAGIVRNVGFKTYKSHKIYRDIIVLDNNFLALDEITGQAIHGLIGSDFFKNTILEIDYVKKKIIIWNPNRFKKSLKKYEKIPVQFLNGKPYVNAKVTNYSDYSTNRKLLLDTGAALSFLLQTKVDSSDIMPSNVIPGSLGKGIGGYLEGYIGTMKKIEIKNWSFDHVLTNFQDIDTHNEHLAKVRDGIIGNLMLERFKIVIDYVQKSLYLKANRNLTKPVSYNKSGMIIFKIGKKLNQFLVFEVLPGSPAEKAGIEKGDIITKLKKLDSKSLTLHQIDKKLRGKKGKKIPLELLRKSEQIKTTLILDDFLRGKT